MGRRTRFAGLLVAIFASALAAPAAHAAFPGANGKIAFDSFSGGDSEIVTVNPDGTGAATLTSNTAEDSEPAWSPNGQRIVFSRVDAVSLQGEIWVMNADGSGQMRLTDDAANGANDRSPAFSGDGGRIVFARNTGQPNFEDEIWVMNADGSGQARLTSGNFDGEPTFSPDSQRISFVRRLEVPGTSVDVIFVMQANGAGQTALTPDDGTMTADGPNFSPDGAELTFSRCLVSGEFCPAPPEVVRMSSTGGPITEVTSNAGNFDDPSDFDPVFSPDRTRIAFNRQEFMTSASNIFTVAAGGGAVSPVTTAGDERNPDWQPIRSSTQSCYGRTATIIGTGEDDKIIGTPGDDVIKGRKGDDVIKGKKGDDILCGQRGDDRLFGGRGDDILIGGKDSDFLKGGPGLDQIFGGTPDAKNKPQVEDICVYGEQDKTNNCKKPD